MQHNRAIADLVSKLKATREGGMREHSWQYLEVKQMGEILARHREKARLAVREYRILKQTIAAESDAIEKLYLSYEAMFLRDHLRDSLRLYVMVNHDFHEAYGAYMKEVKNPGPLVMPVPAELMEPRITANPAKKAPSGRKVA